MTHRIDESLVRHAAVRPDGEPPFTLLLLSWHDYRELVRDGAPGSWEIKSETERRYMGYRLRQHDAVPRDSFVLCTDRFEERLWSHAVGAVLGHGFLQGNLHRGKDFVMVKVPAG